jgi:hypothetical protein
MLLAPASHVLRLPSCHVPRALAIEINVPIFYYPVGGGQQPAKFRVGSVADPFGTGGKQMVSSPYLNNSYVLTGTTSSKGMKTLPSIKDNYTTGIKLQEVSGMQGRQLQVMRLTIGSSAAQCGLISSGDILTRIDGYNVDQNYDILTVRQMLTGMRGSNISLAFRKPTGVGYDVDLVRNVRRYSPTRALFPELTVSVYRVAVFSHVLLSTA